MIGLTDQTKLDPTAMKTSASHRMIVAMSIEASSSETVHSAGRGTHSAAATSASARAVCELAVAVGLVGDLVSIDSSEKVRDRLPSN